MNQPKFVMSYLYCLHALCHHDVSHPGYPWLGVHVGRGKYQHVTCLVSRGKVTRWSMARGSSSLARDQQLERGPRRHAASHPYPFSGGEKYLYRTAPTHVIMPSQLDWRETNNKHSYGGILAIMLYVHQSIVMLKMSMLTEWPEWLKWPDWPDWPKWPM